jgi:stringent starvation protein B
MADTKLESKQDVITRLLNFEYILVFINTSVPGVVIPEYLKKEPTVTLKLSLHFEGKMEIYSDRVEAVLRFKGQYFPCSIPMNAIWGASTPKGSNYFWFEAAPEVVLKAAEKQGDLPVEKREKPILRRIK